MGGILAVAAGQITAETMVFIALTALFVVMTFVGIFAMKSDKEKAKNLRRFAHPRLAVHQR